VPTTAAARTDDPRLDLVLLERTTDEAAAFGRGVVDATVGVLDVATAVHDAADGGRLIAAGISWSSARHRSTGRGGPARAGARAA